MHKSFFQPHPINFVPRDGKCVYFGQISRQQKKDTLQFLEQGQSSFDERYFGRKNEIKKIILFIDNSYRRSNLNYISIRSAKILLVKFDFGSM